MIQLSVKQVSKSYKRKQVLNNVSLNCSRGEIIGLLGRNGSGKSTLFKIIFGVLKARSVQLTIDSKKVLPKEIIPKKIIAFLSQDSSIPKDMKIRNIIPLYFQDGAIQDKIFYAPGVSKFENSKAGNLSLGERKYVELLLLAHLNHPFLILDEPFSMVEPSTRILIKELLLKLKTKKGIIITDHYYKDVLEIADRTYVLNEGFIHPITAGQNLTSLGYLSEK